VEILRGPQVLPEIADFLEHISNSTINESQ
jgi:hypothetical protein